MVLPISHHVFNQKSEVLNGSTPSPLPQKPIALMGGLERYPMQRSASAPEISVYRFERSQVLIDAKAYFNSVWKVDLISFN